MKDVRKRNIARTIFLFVPLLLSLATIASAQNDPLCSMTSVAGQWGYTETGFVFQGTWVPSASQGTYALDRDGNFSGTRFGTVGGDTTIKGTATVNPDCTGIQKVEIFKGENLLSTVEKALLYVDKATEVRAIVTSVVLANGTPVSTVLTVNGKKVFPGHKQ